MTKQSSNLIVENNLEGFFYETLQKVNKKCLRPVEEPIIIYSSRVMGKYGLSHEFFDFTDGRVREKILGRKLLETSQLPVKQLKRELQEIGDLSMLICGYFAESLNNKLIDLSYYQDLGKTAYSRLDNYVPGFLEIPSFYENLARTFDAVTQLMNSVSYMMNEQMRDSDEAFIILSDLGNRKSS